ncbi:MAG: hypothetical protein HN981_00800 [Candidatus Pacebacteria bacterium]|nr:hypothetical protein [Candidatus Paceibacterota bacterium]MBT4652275.1 hypothetical protein [Candidatus Paceibacterota bacterium]MBT6756468.1 hypothetical protein [Candidatus Paceibacterota bacterium]MBT6920919.1 hypothetical protein [Candidatus Paceibacterota bacterium]
MTDKENPFDELHAAFKQLEEKNQAPELENPDYAALLELREAFDDGFKGSVLIERTMFALREYFKSSTLKEPMFLFEDNEMSDESKKKVAELQKIFPDVEGLEFRVIKISAKDINDGTLHGLVLWEKVMPILPTSPNANILIDKLKDYPEATKIVLEGWFIDLPQAIEEINHSGAKTIRKFGNLKENGEE